MGWRQRIADWIAPDRRSGIDPTTLGLHSGAFGGPTLAGPTVTDRSALGISAVWQAVTIYANTVAGLDVYVAEHDPRGGRRPALDHPAYPLVSTRPNPITTSFRFRQSLMLHALTRGNAYAEIERDGRGRPYALHLMEPADVEPIIGPDGGLVYRLNDRGHDLDAADVVHVAGLGWDGLRGFSPITLFRETLGLALGERVYQSALMGNGAQGSGHIETPGHLNTLQLAQFREAWNDMHQGPFNAGKLGILSGGAKWVATSFSPADAQMMIARGFSIAEVARIFNLPQHMLGLLDHATFSNIEHQQLQFYQLSLVPWLKAIEQELNAKLFSPAERRRYFVTHDATSLLRGDLAAQTNWVTDLFAVGMLSRNEGRMRFGLPPVEGGDSYYIPTNNLTPVGAGSGPEPSLDPDAETEGD